jgi:hypothetical protein
VGDFGLKNVKMRGFERKRQKLGSFECKKVKKG